MSEIKEEVKEMSDFDAVMIAEGAQEAESEEQYYAAWDQLLNNGMVYTLQGWFYRMSQQLIAEGKISIKDKRYDQN